MTIDTIERASFCTGTVTPHHITHMRAQNAPLSLHQFQAVGESDSLQQQELAGLAPCRNCASLHGAAAEL